MLSSLDSNHLDTTQLEKIFDLGDYHALKDFLNNNIQKSADDTYTGSQMVFAELNTSSPDIKKIYDKRFNLPRSFASAIADSQNFPMMLLPIYLGLSALGPLTLATIANTLGLLMLGAGIVYHYGTYTDFQKDDKHEMQAFIFSLIQYMAAIELLCRDNENRAKHGLPPNEIDDPKKFIHDLIQNTTANYRKKSVWPRAKSWLTTLFPTAVAGFTLYYCGLSTIGAIFGVGLGVALGPIGISIAAGVALAIGTIFGFMQHRAFRKKEIAEKIHRQIDIKLHQQQFQHTKNVADLEKPQEPTTQPTITENKVPSIQNRNTLFVSPPPLLKDKDKEPAPKMHYHFA